MEWSREEPLNEGADDEADRGCQLGMEEARWNEPTSRTLFTWKSDKEVSRRVRPWSQTSYHEEGGMVDSSERKGCGESGLVERMVAALELGEEGVERRSLSSNGTELV